MSHSISQVSTGTQNGKVRMDHDLQQLLRGKAFWHEFQNLMYKGLLIWTWPSTYFWGFLTHVEKIPFLRRHWNAMCRHSRVRIFKTGLCGMQSQSAEQFGTWALHSRLDLVWRISCRFLGPLLAFVGAFVIFIGILSMIRRNWTHLHSGRVSV